MFLLCSYCCREADRQVARNSMTGIVHLRIVTSIFVFGGALAALPYTVSLFLDDPPPPLIGWIGGIGCIAFAAWFSRGSNIARYFLIIFSILGVLEYT
jgi:hypothetical protein